MAARTPPPGLQLTWLDGQLLAWQPSRGAYGGNLQQEVAAVARRRSLAYGGRTRLVPLHLPDGDLKVMCQTLDTTAIAALAELDLLRAEVSPSVAWFAGLARYCIDLVRNGRVLPSLVHLGTSVTRSEVWQASWRPVQTDVDAVADLAVELGLAGIVATNTTVSRAGLRTPHVDDLGPGGVSGPPVARRALEVLRRLYARVGDRLVLIGVGGIETAVDAWERITAGASLLQGYTGFIYGGGLWAKHIHDGIAQRLHDGGFRSLSEAVGSAHVGDP